MIVSFAVAIAFLEIACALLPPYATQTRETVAARVTILREVRRAVPTPTPVPLRTPVPVKRVAPTQHQAAVIAPSASHRSPKAVPHHLAPVTHARSNRPIWDVAGGQTGNGPGTGVSGAGQGGDRAAQQPCGAVDFDSAPVFTRDPQTGLYVYNDIKMSVHFPDGTTQTIRLDWPWHYKNPQMDPFKQPDAPLWLQFPPKAMRAQEPPLVQYVMAHTTPEGSTELGECPGTPIPMVSP